MYVSMVEMMNDARKRGYGIPALRASNELGLRACIEAAEEKNSPCLLIAGYKMLPDIEHFGQLTRELALRTKVPVAMVLDHGEDFESAIWAIKSGFTDIMVDRSTLPYKENVAQVKELVRIAHAVGVGVEAELGHVGSGEDYEADGISGLTVPDEAIEYVNETGIDTLAVAIGTAHGVYKGVPKLRFDLLNELREKLDVPLVLHGGSGTGDENLSKACQMGITKVNIANDLYQGSIKEMNANDLDGKGAYRLFAYISKGYKEAAMKYMDICGSTGKFITSGKSSMGDSTSMEGLDETEIYKK